MKSLVFMLKGLFIPMLFLLPLTLPAQTRGIVWEYQIVTAVESVIPGGLGRSRLLLSDDGGVLEEYKMENFFPIPFPGLTVKVMLV